MEMFEFLFLFLKTSDWLALIVAGAIGYVAGLFVPHGWYSVFTSILISYHLFLGWLLLTAKSNLQVIRPRGLAFLIHLVCVAVIVSIGAGRLFVPYFDIACCGVAVLAFFERDWLFVPAMAPVPEGGEIVISSAEEYKEWLDHLAKHGKDAADPAISRKEQFESWLRDHRKHAQAPGAGSPE